MSTHKSVTLVTVTYNSSDVLPDFMASLPDALEGVENFHVVVSDNQSRDGSADLAKVLWPRATIVHTGGNLGYAAGINRAVAAGPTNDAIYVLNPDIRLAPGSVQLLLDALDKDDVGISVPRIRDGEGRLVKSLRREPSVSRAWGEAVLGGGRAGRIPWLGEMVLDEESYVAPRDADWASGCAVMISRRCWDVVGPWDESFWLYSEETSFALRAHDAGFRIRYVPGSEAVHLAGASHRNPMLWSVLVCNRARLFRQRHGPVESAAFYAALVVGEGFRSIGGNRIHKAAFHALVRPSSRPAEIR